MGRTAAERNICCGQTVDCIKEQTFNQNISTGMQNPFRFQLWTSSVMLKTDPLRMPLQTGETLEIKLAFTFEAKGQ